MNVLDLVARIAGQKTVIGSVQQLLIGISRQIESLENQGGGALQPQLKDMRTRLMAGADQIGVAIAANTSADQEALDHVASVETSEQVLERQKAMAEAPPEANMGQTDGGAAQAAADSLKAQDDKPPGRSSKKK